MRIGIANDMPLAILVLRRALERRPQHEIVWVVGNGSEAVEACLENAPDLVLMDLVMPVMDGVEATRRIMRNTPCAILVVTSSVSGNVHKAFEAMSLGALDVVETPMAEEGGGAGEVDAEAFLKKIDLMSRLADQGSDRVLSSSERFNNTEGDQVRPLVVVGASAGGPGALAELLRGLDADFEAPIVVVQHLDLHFSEALVEWLSSQSPLPVRLASERDIPKAGEVLLAKGGANLVLLETQKLGYTREPESFHSPSIDVFFQSVARYWKGTVMGVLLTGMGRDGAAGLLELRLAGFHTLVQDEESSVVYGMPGAAVKLGAAKEILPMSEIANGLKRWCRKLRLKA